MLKTKTSFYNGIGPKKLLLKISLLFNHFKCQCRAYPTWCRRRRRRRRRL